MVAIDDEALSQFMMITTEDLSTARAYIQSANGNVETAVSNYFNGIPPSRSPAPTPAPAPAQPQYRPQPQPQHVPARAVPQNHRERPAPPANRSSGGFFSKVKSFFSFGRSSNNVDDDDDDIHIPPPHAHPPIQPQQPQPQPQQPQPQSQPLPPSQPNQAMNNGNNGLQNNNPARSSSADAVSNNPPRLSLDKGRREAVAFVENFHARFNSNTIPAASFGMIPWFEESYTNALAIAREAERPIFIYLHSAQHHATDEFCRSFLCNTAFVNYAVDNYVCWGADVTSTEGQVIANSFQVTTFPYFAIIEQEVVAEQPVSNGSSNAGRPASAQILLLYSHEGPMTESIPDLLTKLMLTIENHREKEQKHRENQQQQNLRSFQNEEYDVIARQDELFLQQRTLEEQRAKEEIEEQKNKLLQQEEARKKKLNRIADATKGRKEFIRHATETRAKFLQDIKTSAESSHTSTDVVDVADVGIRLPSGARLTVKANRKAPLGTLHRQIMACPEATEELFDLPLVIRAAEIQFPSIDEHGIREVIPLEEVLSPPTGPKTSSIPEPEPFSLGLSSTSSPSLASSAAPGPTRPPVSAMESKTNVDDYKQNQNQNDNDGDDEDEDAEEFAFLRGKGKPKAKPKPFGKPTGTLSSTTSSTSNNTGNGVGLGLQTNAPSASPGLGSRRFGAQTQASPAFGPLSSVSSPSPGFTPISLRNGDAALLTAINALALLPDDVIMERYQASKARGFSKPFILTLPHPRKVLSDISLNFIDLKLGKRVMLVLELVDNTEPQQPQP